MKTQNLMHLMLTSLVLNEELFNAVIEDMEQRNNIPIDCKDRERLFNYINVYEVDKVTS